MCHIHSNTFGIANGSDSIVQKECFFMRKRSSVQLTESANTMFDERLANEFLLCLTVRLMDDDVG